MDACKFLNVIINLDENVDWNESSDNGSDDEEILDLSDPLSNAEVWY